jgi:hypothetical protein
MCYVIGLYPYGYHIAVKLCVQDADLNLKPGMPADVIFEAGRQRNDL